MALKRAGPESAGVRPPCLNQAWPRMMVEPAAMKLMATPETIWLPRWVIEAKPCTIARSTAIRIAATRPSQAEPVTAAAAAPAKAAASILPSSPMSKTPARSE